MTPKATAGPNNIRLPCDPISRKKDIAKRKKDIVKMLAITAMVPAKNNLILRLMGLENT